MQNYISYSVEEEDYLGEVIIDKKSPDLGTPTRHNYKVNRSDLEDFKRRRRTGQRPQDNEGL
jgi:hypothetical protein